MALEPFDELFPHVYALLRGDVTQRFRIACPELIRRVGGVTLESRVQLRRLMNMPLNECLVKVWP